MGTSLKLHSLCSSVDILKGGIGVSGKIISRGSVLSKLISSIIQNLLTKWICCDILSDKVKTMFPLIQVNSFYEDVYKEEYALYNYHIIFQNICYIVPIVIRDKVNKILLEEGLTCKITGYYLYAYIEDF